MLNLIVNDSPHEHTGDGTVPDLLAELGATPEHTALTVNGDLVPIKNCLPSEALAKEGGNFKLTDGDAVEVLTFVGGG